MVVIISIEGNIGSGKSTFVKNLAKVLPDLLKKYKIIFLQEPIDEWNNIKDEHGITILEKFYNDQKKYAFSFQMMAYISRLNIIKNTVKNNPQSIIITERSMFTDREVFAKMLYDEKKIELIDYKIYLKWFDSFIEDYPIDGLIYINTNPEICKKRIIKRARKGENISIEYLKSCHTYHDKWLSSTETDIIFLDGNLNFNENILNDWVYKIINFINLKRI